MESTKTTLGRSLKIAKIVEQRNYIEKAINEKIQMSGENGDPSIIYTGHIFPENMLWLTEEEKINIFKVKETQHCPKKYGIPSYVLVPSSDILLNEEEMKESKMLYTEKRDNTKDFEKSVSDFLDYIGIDANENDKKLFTNFLNDITGGNTNFVSDLLNIVGMDIDKENENDSDEESSHVESCHGLDCDENDGANECCTGKCLDCKFKDTFYKDDSDDENLCNTDPINDEPCDDDNDTLKPPYTI